MQGYVFAERTRLLLARARVEAMDAKHQYVGPEHMLLALIRAIDPICAGMLARFQVDATDVEHEIMRRLDHSEAGATGPDLPFTSRAKKVLELAMAEARDLRHSYIGNEHLLLGILREDKSIAAEALVDLGVELETARMEAIRLLGHRGEPVTCDTSWPPWLTGIGPLTHQLTDIFADANDARTPEDLLLALIADIGGARHVLEVCGVDVGALSDEIGARDPGASGGPTSIRQLMAAALTEQKYLGDCAVATHHILLAYLALRPAHGYRALSDRGVTHASVRALAEKIFG